MTITLLDLSTATKGGDMTGGASHAGIWDSNTATAGHKTAPSGYSWVLLPSAVKINKIALSGNGLGFDASGATSGITINIRRSATEPTSATSGALIAAQTFTDVNAIVNKEITINETTAADGYLLVQVVSNYSGAYAVLSKCEVYVEDSAPPSEPTAFTQERYKMHSYCDEAILLGYQLTEITPLRQTFKLENPAALSLYARVDLEHNGVSTGFLGGISLGSIIFYRYGTTFAAMEAASWQQVPRALYARNLDERDPQHYATMLPSGAFPLEGQAPVGFYQFGIRINANTSASGYYNTNGLAKVLVEGGTGLNLFTIEVDHVAHNHDMSAEA